MSINKAMTIKWSLNVFIFLLASILVTGCGSTSTAKHSSMQRSYTPPPVKKDKMSQAIRTQNLGLINQLIKDGYSISSSKPRIIRGYSHTLLTDAVQSADYRILKIMLLNGANPNASNLSNPLCLALYLKLEAGRSIAQTEETINLLLAAGANPNLKCQSKYVRGSSHLKYTYTHKDISYPLHQAAKFDSHIKIVKALLASGASVNQKDNDGMTAFHQTLDMNYKITGLLIEMGADVNSKSNDGSTPLHYAASWDEPKVVRMLMEAGADINSTDKLGSTPLDETFDVDGKIESPAANRVIKRYGGKLVYEKERRQKERKKNKSNFGKVFATLAIAGMAASADISASDTSKVMSATLNDIWIEDGKGNHLGKMHRDTVKSQSFVSSGSSGLDDVLRAKQKQNSASAIFKQEMLKNQAIIKAKRQKNQTPSLYQQQLGRIAKSKENNSVNTRSSKSVSTSSHKQRSGNSTSSSNSGLASNRQNIKQSSECSSPAYTTPSFTVEGKNSMPYNSVGAKVNNYMNKTCGSSKPSSERNPKIQCDVLEKIKSKVFSNLTRERCTSEPLTFTCGCESNGAGSGRSM